MNPQFLEQFATDLELVLNNVLTSSSLEKYRSLSKETEVVMSNLDHYWADGDIREKDPAYKVMQDSELRKLLVLLRSQAPLSQLQQVTFLGPSSVA